ncbi:hypothetical protein ACFLYH_03010 [Candidatus Dependentiae bacterium]
MTISAIQISAINLILGLIIFFIGFNAHKTNKNPIIFAVGNAFAFFGTSHLFSIYDIKNKICILFFIIFRVIAYFLIIFALNKVLKKKLSPLLSKRIILRILNIILKIIPFILSALLVYYCVIMYKFFTLDMSPKVPIYFLNATLCLFIVLLSFLLYKFTKKHGLLFLSFAFFFFMTSHLAIVFNLEETFTIAIIIIRIFAYLFTITTLYSLIGSKVIHLTSIFTSKTHFQILLITFTTTMLLFLFYIPHINFTASDRKPNISPIIPTNTEVKIVEVKVGLYIKGFPTFNVSKNNFTMNSIVWFEFNPHLISTEELEKFAFENGKILYKSPPITKLIGNKMLSTYDLIVNFKSNLNYNFFPLEDHTIYISIINTQLNPNEVLLTTKNTDFFIKKEIFTENWKYQDIKTFYGISTELRNKNVSDKITPFPIVVFGLDFEQAGSKNILIIFVPLFIAFFLGLFSLVLNIKNTKGILTLSVASVSSLIFNLFILEGKTPQTTYFTISDSIFTFLFATIFIILVFNLFLIRFISQKKPSDTLIILRNYIFLFMIVFLILYIYYLLY